MMIFLYDRFYCFIYTFFESKPLLHKYGAVEDIVLPHIRA